MARAATQVIRQRDFSTGELVDSSARRDDLPLVRSGARQLRNWRILTTGAVENRPGRPALFSEYGRVDEVRMKSGTIFYLCFSSGVLRIRDANGALVTAQGGYPWSATNADQIVWARHDNDIVICFAGSRPVVAKWDGTSTWTFSLYTYLTRSSSTNRAPFYRMVAPGATMLPSAVTGAITVVFSEDVLNASHVGVVFRFAGRRLQITSVTDAKNGAATVIEKLFITNRIGFTAGDELNFTIGDVVTGATSGATGVVVDVDTTSNYIYVQVLSRMKGFNAEDIVGPRGRATAGSAITVAPLPCTVWDEEAISDARGWPRSVTTDRGRLIFCDVPNVPSMILWSAVGSPYDLDVGALATSAMVELVANSARVYHVLGGADQLVFTNIGVFYIPISESNPLKPGSVTFRQVTPDAASQVRPAEVAEGALFVNEAGKRIVGIYGTGQTAQPYASVDTSEWNAHLFTNVKVLAAADGGGDFPERYIFAVNADGSAAIGRLIGLNQKNTVGWTPWAAGGGGAFDWISCLGAVATIGTTYTVAGAAVHLIEQLSLSAYLDAQIALNAVPSPLAGGTEADILILPAIGTAIGDMTAGGGLAAAFDGTTAKAAAASSSKAANTGYVGRTLPVALPIKKVEVWPASDSGFALGEAGSITLQLYGKNGAAPANSTDGTLLGTSTAADAIVGPVTINSSDTATPFLHRWVRNNNAAATNVYAAQTRHYTNGLRKAAAGGGTASLWMFAGGTVKVMKGLLPLGDRTVDATGAIVLGEGDDLSDAAIVVGFDWTATLEPFVPHANEGQSLKQTLHKRAIHEAAAAVQLSTGFKVSNTRVAAWKAGEDQAIAPPQREEVVTFNVKGQDFDPRFQLVKDTPGTLRVIELSFEVDI